MAPCSLWLFITLICPLVSGLTTCPGFPGYCSESFPGFTCNVVCDVGRNNVPLCQEDGTWTDIPRCIEHDPGVEEQIPGLCVAIPGYCSQGFLNHRCQFDCRVGKDIDSICTADGTWSPYPTCEGDIRETQDGCDGCPGPRGEKRNRTAEAIVSANTISDRRVPKIVVDDGGRKTVPSFAGNINIGRVSPTEKPSSPPPTTRTTRLPQSVKRTPVQATFRKPGEQVQQQQQPSVVGLIDRISNRIDTNQKPKQTKPTFRQPAQPPTAFQTAAPIPSKFGVFDAVDLGGSPTPDPKPRVQQNGEQKGFFGEFKTVNLQG